MNTKGNSVSVVHHEGLEAIKNLISLIKNTQFYADNRTSQISAIWTKRGLKFYVPTNNDITYIDRDFLKKRRENPELKRDMSLVSNGSGCDGYELKVNDAMKEWIYEAISEINRVLRTARDHLQKKQSTMLECMNTNVSRLCKDIAFVGIGCFIMDAVPSITMIDCILNRPSFLNMSILAEGSMNQPSVYKLIGEMFRRGETVLVYDSVDDEGVSQVSSMRYYAADWHIKVNAYTVVQTGANTGISGLKSVARSDERSNDLELLADAIWNGKKKAHVSQQVSQNVDDVDNDSTSVIPQRKVKKQIEKEDPKQVDHIKNEKDDIPEEEEVAFKFNENDVV